MLDEKFTLVFFASFHLALVIGRIRGISLDLTIIDTFQYLLLTLTLRDLVTSQELMMSEFIFYLLSFLLSYYYKLLTTINLQNVKASPQNTALGTCNLCSVCHHTNLSFCIYNTTNFCSFELEAFGLTAFLWL